MSLFATSIEVNSPTAAVVVVLSILSSALTAMLTRGLNALDQYKNGKQRRRFRSQLHKHRLAVEQKVTAAYEEVLNAVREECRLLRLKFAELAEHATRCDEGTRTQQKMLDTQQIKIDEQAKAITELQHKILNQQTLLEQQSALKA